MDGHDSESCDLQNSLRSWLGRWAWKKARKKAEESKSKKGKEQFSIIISSTSWVFFYNLPLFLICFVPLEFWFELINNDFA